MTRKSYRTSIPADAVEVVEQHHPGGAKKRARYLVGDEVVGYREWDEEGWLDYECPLKGGLRHGREYRFYPNGHPIDEDSYREGRLHGVCREWAEDGTLLVTSTIAHGCGLSLWCDNCTGKFAEETYFPRAGERGYRRLWNEDERTVREEEVQGRARAPSVGSGTPAAGSSAASHGSSSAAGR